jgi:RimJ/RimL family protein N-acetyltransferase
MLCGMRQRLIIPTEQDKLELRELWTRQDDEAYFAAVEASRPQLNAYDQGTADRYRSVDDVTHARLVAAHIGRLRFGIFDDQQFVGTLNKQGQEIGYWLDTRQTGHGYATLAVRGITAHFRDLYALVHPDNTPSLQVMERSGFEVMTEHLGYIIFAHGQPDLDFLTNTAS